MQTLFRVILVIAMAVVACFACEVVSPPLAPDQVPRDQPLDVVGLELGSVEFEIVDAGGDRAMFTDWDESTQPRIVWDADVHEHVEPG